MAFLKAVNNHFWICFGSILIVKQKKCFEHIKTNSNFFEITLGFIDSGLGVRSDEQVEELSFEIQLKKTFEPIVF